MYFLCHINPGQHIQNTHRENSSATKSWCKINFPLLRHLVNSPGHNHFWILDDVTNMNVVVGPRGNSLITLFEP